MNPFRVVGVIGKQRAPHVPTLAALCSALRELGCEVLLECNTCVPGDLPAEIVSREQLAQRAHLVVVVGGDGPLLGAGRALAPAGLPLLGVNQGRLGFMTDVRPEAMRETLAAIMQGEYQAEDRLILSARVLRATGEVLPYTAINDVVIRNQASIRMLEFETWSDQEFISTHRADGMIVSSPTGSTAYALSGGGPLIHPSLNALLLVPICPHTPSDRPIVLSGDRTVKLVVRGSDDRNTQATVTFDGQTGETLEPGDVVEIGRAPFPLRLIHPTTYNYFGILRNKLRWGRGPDTPPLERA